MGRIEFAVALKALSEGSTAASRVKFLQEAAIMAQFRHSNIVSLYGVISKDEPVSRDHECNSCVVYQLVTYKSRTIESIVLSCVHGRR